MDISIHFIYLSVICILIIILLIYKHMNTNATTPTLKGAYLNYSSTNSRRNGSFNPSDLAYPQVMDERKDFNGFAIHIKKLINAPADASVIINSGATESIATCISWAKNYNQYGVVQGTDFDHSAVKDNCDNLGVPYDNTALRKNKILDNCAMIFITQVNSRNGEYLDLNNFKRNVLDKYQYLHDSIGLGHSLSGNNHIRQYKPLVVLDATQSICKIPIDMERWGLNAVFFSLHKLGAPIGSGIFVLHDPTKTFKPLIAGKQQDGLRGGTFPLDTVLNHAFVFDEPDDFNTRKQSWQHAFDKLTAAGLHVYKPNNNHLFNTLLIDVHQCPLAIINALAQQSIYVGNVSACANETEQKKAVKGGGKEEQVFAPFERSIRISFKKANELSDGVLDAIIKVVKE